MGLVGGGNVSLWDAIARRKATTLVSCHHEQAACMAATYANRVAGRQIACALVTTGAGSTNAVTAVMAAWMDSVPLFVIAGNESSHFQPHERGMGVQGFYSAEFVAPCTKFSSRISAESPLERVLDRAWNVAQTRRPGPVWVEIPQDLQRG